MSKQEWKWSVNSTDFTLKIDLKSLENHLLLFSALENQKTQEIFESFDVFMNKTLIFDENHEWLWHKNWNIPLILLNLRKSPNFFENDDICVGLYIIKQIDTLLVNVGLTGETVYRLNKNIEETVRFPSIKINTTSHYHEGKKFKLLMVFFKEKLKKPIFSLVSSAFFVDSRELIRKYSDSKKIAPYLEPFLPGVLLKRMINKKNKEIFKKIENSLEGLYNYVSAQNLKFKVKHPIFLLYRFSNVFSLFYKPFEKKDENIIFKLQNSLYINYSSIYEGNDRGKYRKNEDFLLLIREKTCELKTKYQRISDMLRIIDKHLISVVMNPTEIPIGYEEFKNKNTLKALYKLSYPYLKSENMANFNRNSKKPLKTLAFDKKEEELEFMKKKIKTEEIPAYNYKIAKIKEIKYNSHRKPIEVISSINSLMNVLLSKYSQENIKKNKDIEINPLLKNRLR